SDALHQGEAWTARLRGLRANASTRSHAELDAASDLDIGDPADLGRRYRALCSQFGHFRVLGGCCGTDHRHVEQISLACVPVDGVMFTRPSEGAMRGRLSSGLTPRMTRPSVMSAAG